MAKADALGTEARELVDLVVGYAKQETVDPLKRLGKSIAFGVLGAILVGLGTIFGSLAALRAMQTETDVFEDELAFLPYLILTVFLLLAGAVGWKTLGAGGRGGRGEKRKRR